MKTVKKIIALMLMFVLAFSLTACELPFGAGEDDTETVSSRRKHQKDKDTSISEPDPEPEPDPNTDPDSGEPIDLTDDEITFFTSFLSDIPVNGFLWSSFEDVRDASLYYPLYNAGHTVTDEQRARALELAGEEEVYTGVFRLTHAEIDEILQKYTGYKLDEFRTWLEDWYHDYEDDSYYKFCGDVCFTPVIVTDGYKMGDRYTLHVIEDQNYWGEVADRGFRKNRLEMELEKVGDDYHVAACRELYDENIAPDWCYKVTFPFYGECEFYTYMPSEDNLSEVSTFKLIKDGRTVETFGEYNDPNFVPGNFMGVKDLGFKDFNYDGFPDFVAIIAYDSYAGVTEYEYKVFKSSEWKYTVKDPDLEQALSDAGLDHTYESAYNFLCGYFDPVIYDGNEWKKSYLDRIDSFDAEGDESARRSYDLIYVDEDNIPELVCVGDCEAAATRILTWYRGGLTDNIWTGRLYFEYISRKSLLLDCEGHMGYYWDIVYELDQGHFTQVALGEYGEDTSKDPDPETGYPYFYKFNNREVSEEQYYKELAKYYDKNSSIPGYNWERLLSKEELTNMLTDTYSKLY